MQVGSLAGCGRARQVEADAAFLAMYGRVAPLQAKARELGHPVLHIRHDASRAIDWRPRDPVGRSTRPPPDRAIISWENATATPFTGPASWPS